MYYLIDIQPFTPNLQHFLAGKVIVLYDACCTTYQPSVLHSHGSKPIGQKPTRPGPLIFEPVGRLVLSVGRAPGKRHIDYEIFNQLNLKK